MDYKKLLKLTDSTYKVQDSIPELDTTNSVIYNYEFDETEHPGFEGSVDDNVLYIFKEGASERAETKDDALASLFIDKMGQVHYNIYRNVSGLRQVCESLKVEIEDSSKVNDSAVFQVKVTGKTYGGDSVEEVFASESKSEVLASATDFAENLKSATIEFVDSSKTV